MKAKRNWLVVAITIIMAGSLTGCIGDSPNTQDFEWMPSYMNIKNGNFCMETLAGDVYISSSTTSVNEYLYEFGLSWFNINYDEQPVGTDGINVPYTAVLHPNGWIPVKNGYLRTSEGELPDSHVDTIIDAFLLYNQLIRNHAFFVMREEAPGDREYRYYMTLNTDSTAQNDGIPALYIQAEITSAGSETPKTVDHFFAFSMDELFYDGSYVKDITIGGASCESVEFSLHVQSSVDKETGKPIFTQVFVRDAQTGSIVSRTHSVFRVK